MNDKNPPRRVELYDTTLRDGTQGEGVSLTLTDKLKIARLLDELGFDYIEGGYPLSNPKDQAFFEEAARIDFQNARVCAFGMTRRRGVKAEDDPGMKALAATRAPVHTIVGKTWDLHVDEVLGVSRQENLDMIRETLAFCKQVDGVADVFYDAEHFFDGFKANAGYAVQTLQAAIDGGATRLVLCDTNGGSLPQEITAVIDDLKNRLSIDSDVDPQSLPSLAIHVHNDGGLAVANSLAAVEDGAVQVQGTINGIGERCGNVDLIPVAANLALKLGYDCLLNDGKGIDRLTELSRAVDDLANLRPNNGQPFVGASAFAHKGGMHVHAVQKLAHTYEHVPPESVGNRRRILVSELSGASNIAATLGEKYNIASDKNVQRRVLEKVQDLENQGYQFEAAGASFELLLQDELGLRKPFWNLDHYRCVIARRDSEAPVTEATVKLALAGETEHRVAEGDGPVNALDGALRKCLRDHYPQIDRVHLTDYKVRVVNPKAETAAKVRVVIEFQIKSPDSGGTVASFSTIGVNENIVDASWEALSDALQYFLLDQSVEAKVASI